MQLPALYRLASRRFWGEIQAISRQCFQTRHNLANLARLFTPEPERSAHCGPDPADTQDLVSASESETSHSRPRSGRWQVPQGRPAPWACYRMAERLGVYPLSHAIKIGDTPADIAEGRNAGMISIGLSECGNEVGLSMSALQSLPAAERLRKIGIAEQRLKEAGADAVLRSAAELPAWIGAQTA